MRHASLERFYVADDAENYPAKAVFGPLTARAEAEGCRVFRIDAGHDIMLEAPGELADVILTAAHE